MRDRYFVVIGDLVGSRALAEDERAPIQRRLLELTDDLSALASHGSPAAFSVIRGDEFEGMLDDADVVSRVIWKVSGAFGSAVRLGIGYGGLSTEFSDNVLENDGPVFHYAREALESIPRRGRISGPEKIAFRAEDAAASSVVDGLVAILWNRYRGLTSRQRYILELLRDGRRQSEIAEALGMTRQSVADAVSGAGVDAILRAEESLRTALRGLAGHGG